MLNSQAEKTRKYTSNYRKCGTSFENTGMFDLRIARSVCASTQFNDCLGAPVYAQYVKRLPIDREVPGSASTWGGDLFNSKQVTNEYSFS